MDWRKHHDVTAGSELVVSLAGERLQAPATHDSPVKIAGSPSPRLRARGESPRVNGDGACHERCRRNGGSELGRAWKFRTSGSN